MVDKRLIAGMSLVSFLSVVVVLIANTPVSQIYYCQGRDLVQYCESRSDTNKTCYFNVNDVKTSKTCITTTWRPISEFANVTIKGKGDNLTDEQILARKSCFICDEELMKEIKMSILPNNTVADIENHITEKRMKKLGNGLVNVEYIFDTPLNEKGDLNLNIVGYEENIIIAPKL